MKTPEQKSAKTRKQKNKGRFKVSPFSCFRERRGFSLIEMLTVIAIFSIITSVILVNQSRFNSSMLVTSLAYEVALAVREAQVYGLAVKESDGGFAAGYGIHFTTDSSTFLLFTEKSDPANGSYDEGKDGVEKTYTLRGGNSVVELCAASDCSLATLDIVYLRPSPDIKINGNKNIAASIKIESPRGEQRTVIVNTTGQISVQ
jgi:prepilin-type N-terminal cleavage/methylation domain-containing protein